MAAQPEEVSPEQIRERMADTRAAMSARLELLRAQATPRALLTRGLSGGRHKRHDDQHDGAADADRPQPGLAGTVYRQLRQHPVLVVAAVALLGAAAAVIIPGPRRR
jgi:uncharacterized protein DUF3618